MNKCPATWNLADISCEAVSALCCVPFGVGRDMPVGLASSLVSRLEFHE